MKRPRLPCRRAGGGGGACVAGRVHTGGDGTAAAAPPCTRRQPRNLACVTDGAGAAAGTSPATAALRVTAAPPKPRRALWETDPTCIVAAPTCMLGALGSGTHPARRVDDLPVAHVHEVVVALPRLYEVLLPAHRMGSTCGTASPLRTAAAAPPPAQTATPAAPVRLVAPAGGRAAMAVRSGGTAAVPAVVLLLLQHLPQVLDHKLAGLQVLTRKQAKALGPRPLLRSTAERRGQQPHLSLVSATGCRES